MRGRALLLVAVAAFLAGVAVVVAAHGVASRSATPAPSPRPADHPTVAPRATAAPTTTVFTATTPSATAATATSTSSSSPNVRVADRAAIRARGYVVDRGASAPDGAGETLYAWIATCAGSADGHCQRVFFFAGSRYLGTDTKNDSNEIMGIAAAGRAAIAVTYADYLPGDPLCCPSGKPVNITYRWTGSRLIPSGAPPQ